MVSKTKPLHGITVYLESTVLATSLRSGPLLKGEAESKNQLQQLKSFDSTYRVQF